MKFNFLLRVPLPLVVLIAGTFCGCEENSQSSSDPSNAAPKTPMTIAGPGLKLVQQKSPDANGKIAISDKEWSAKLYDEVELLWGGGMAIELQDVNSSVVFELHFTEHRKEFFLVPPSLIWIEGAGWRQSEKVADTVKKILRYIVELPGNSWSSAALHTPYLTEDERRALLSEIQGVPIGKPPDRR
jgi:hypothetical protein